MRANEFRSAIGRKLVVVFWSSNLVVEIQSVGFPRGLYDFFIIRLQTATLRTKKKKKKRKYRR